MRFNGHTPITTFSGDNPFSGIPKQHQKAQMATQKKPTIKHGNLPKFEICTDPIVPRRVPDGMYPKILKSLKPGECIKCSMDDVGRIANALRDHVAKQMPDFCIKSTRDYGDGMGRVWLIKREK